MQQLFHGSHSRIDFIRPDGLFGGIFASVGSNAARSHGDILHVVGSWKPLDDFTLNYEIENAFEVALDVCGGVISYAMAIMSPDCSWGGDPDIEWELQRLRGELARRLGYDSVEMRDEHGTTWLCLPGCVVTPTEDEI